VKGIRIRLTLKQRLILVYALCISCALIVLTAGIDRYTQSLFSSLVSGAIAQKQQEIIRSISELYDPLSDSYDVKTVEALGMHFTHEGYIVIVRDAGRRTVWDARRCNMAECNRVLNEIKIRMDKTGESGQTAQIIEYPVSHAGRPAGSISIETFGPLFYSRGESVFLVSLNRLFFLSFAVLTAVSIIIAVVLTSVVLNEADKKQRQLTSDVAHELRTPLACLQGSMEALTDGIWEPTPERLAGCSEEILRLTKLVNDLTLLTDIEWEHITLHKTTFDLAELIETAAEPFRSAAYKKGIFIRLELNSGTVCADYDRISQVFANILSNALKYTDTGGITVRCSGREAEISDTGIGIDPGELPHIFERFYRTDKSRARATGGSGIGLTIAYGLVKAHGGTITADSVPGKGTTFRVML